MWPASGIVNKDIDRPPPRQAASFIGPNLNGIEMLSQGLTGYKALIYAVIFTGALTLATTALTAAQASMTIFSYSGGLQYYTVPTTGLYDITAFGAQGGAHCCEFSGAAPALGGSGAEIGGDVALTAGQTLTILVGGAGAGSAAGGGGGGGSYVVFANDTPLVIAGGGGGGSVYPGGNGLIGNSGDGGGGAGGGGAGGGGGGGFSGSGADGGYVGGGGGGGFPGSRGGNEGCVFMGEIFASGGFGGGGGGGCNGAAFRGGGGGGGGYSGGDGGGSGNGGDGGSSFLASNASDHVFGLSPYKDGLVDVSFVQAAPAPTPGTGLLSFALLILMGVTSRPSGFRARLWWRS